MPELAPEERQSRFRTLKSLIPFLEGLGFRVKRGVDHITIFPYPENKVEVKFDGTKALKDIEDSVKKLVTENIDRAVKKFEDLKQLVSKEEVK